MANDAREPWASSDNSNETRAKIIKKKRRPMYNILNAVVRAATNLFFIFSLPVINNNTNAPNNYIIIILQ